MQYSITYTRYNLLFFPGNYNWSVRTYFLCNERNSFTWDTLSFWTGKWNITYPKPDILHTLTHSYWFLWKYIKNWQQLSSERINKISNRYLPQFLVIYDLLLFVKSQGTLLNCKSHAEHANHINIILLSMTTVYLQYPESSYLIFWIIKTKDFLQET